MDICNFINCFKLSSTTLLSLPILFLSPLLSPVSLLPLSATLNYPHTTTAAFDPLITMNVSTLHPSVPLSAPPLSKCYPTPPSSASSSSPSCNPIRTLIPLPRPPLQPHYSPSNPPSIPLIRSLTLMSHPPLLAPSTYPHFRPLHYYNSFLSP